MTEANQQFLDCDPEDLKVNLPKRKKNEYLRG
jgi:hypothetical protein